MTAIQAIKIINRRAKTLLKLFGANSDIYDAFSTVLTEFDFNENARGLFTLKNNALNRAEYRKLTAWAKRIQKTPYAVLKRKADKLKKQIEDDAAFFDDIGGDDDIKDLNVYYKWLSTFTDYFESCYELATMNGFQGYGAYEYAKELYDDRGEYVKQWNYFYNAGAFDEYKKNYEQDFIKRVNDIDDETGEMQPKKNFSRGL